MNSQIAHTEAKPTSDELKARVLKVKPMVGGKYKRKIIALAPKFDTVAGSQMMENVWYLRATNEEITEILEKIAAQSQPTN